MQKVMIPSSANPFVIYVNGMKYTYPAGTIQEVPDDVALIIERYQEDRNKEPDPVNPPFDCCGCETGAGSGGAVQNAVLYTEQPLTPEQKAQARANVGAVSLQEVLDKLPVYDGEVVPV